MAHIEPTEGQLQAAFSGVRRPGWPEVLADALAHPLYGRLIRMNAMLLAEGRDPFVSQRIRHRPEVIPPEPPHPADALPASASSRPRRLASISRPSQLPLIDRKRAAAGDGD
jgi:hypothetical protein